MNVYGRNTSWLNVIGRSGARNGMLEWTLLTFPFRFASHAGFRSEPIFGYPRQWL
jgi:hypothetical protein